MKAILDIETSWTIIPPNRRPNPSPFLESNKLISVGILFFDDEGIKEQDYLIFNHTEVDHDCQANSFSKLQKYLLNIDLIIGHNLKFDMSWLYTCGFNFHDKLYDTMIAEYVFCKGLKQPINLKDSCARYGLEAKSDILGEYRDKGVNTDAVPLQELIDYGKQDILITKQLYDTQQDLVRNSLDHMYMSKAVDLMNDTLPVIIDMERNGIAIDLEELSRVESQYRQEYDSINAVLKQLVINVMGHTPINLNSPEHLSWVIHGRRVLDKALWKETFNLGYEVRNSVVKIKYTTRMTTKELAKILKDNTEKLRKTVAKQCEVCNGTSRIRKSKKDGTAFKNETICHDCQGNGYNYIATTSYAGFKLLPLGSEFAAVGGFSTDKVTILELLKDDNITPECRAFLTGLLRMSAISTYLSTFCEGIRKNVFNNILHTSFNQCITTTGRLSSSNPNFQNLPRAKTFPIRRVIKSRWNGGKILSVDFKQLEFRVAAILAGDKQAEEDILNNIDIHLFTRDTITAAGQPMDRQDAKIRTFKPLYGGIKGTSAEEAYYKSFLQKYKDIDKWQHDLENEALNTKQIKSPSGRIYSFPFVRRLPSGCVVGHTQIKNYIVQGFATGDINPLALIKIHKAIKHCGMKSKIILSVHDDITIDVHPDEIESAITMIRHIFSTMNKHVEDKFGIKTNIPIEGEMSIGDNWLDKHAI
jgi:DNA polymerase I-like protein with 3'-5' exonuclease and polymerase domains